MSMATIRWKARFSSNWAEIESMAGRSCSPRSPQLWSMRSSESTGYSLPRTLTVPRTRPVMSKWPFQARDRPDLAIFSSWVPTAWGVCLMSCTSKGSMIPFQSTWISVSSKPT